MAALLIGILGPSSPMRSGSVTNSGVGICWCLVEFPSSTCIAEPASSVCAIMSWLSMAPEVCAAGGGEEGVSIMTVGMVGRLAHIQLVIRKM